MAFPLLLLFILTSSACKARDNIDDPRFVDRVVRDSAFQLYRNDHHKTAILYDIPIPAALSAVSAKTIRYRAGHLRRHGANIAEFTIPQGIVFHPHAKRLLIISQNLGNLSSIYNSYVNISNYSIVSPVLGLLFYRSNSSQPKNLVSKIPIRVNFSELVHSSTATKAALCAQFQLDGNVSLSKQTGSNGCSAWSQGHFALVSAKRSDKSNECSEGGVMKLNGWKVVLVSVAASMFVAVLLGLLVVAVVSAKRKRMWTVEMERRAYEDEALQVSMVGHVRAPTAAAARTLPILEHDYVPNL